MYEYMYEYMYKPGTAEQKNQNGRYRLFLSGFNLVCLEYTPPLYRIYYPDLGYV